MNKTLLISSSLLVLLTSSVQAQNMLVTFKDGRNPFLKTFNGKQTLQISDQFPDNDVSITPWNHVYSDISDQIYNTDWSSTQATLETTSDGQQVLHVIPTTDNRQTKIAFSSPITLYGTYDIYASFVGAQCVNPEDTLPTQLRASLFVPYANGIFNTRANQFRNPTDNSLNFHVPAEKDSCLLIGSYTFQNTSQVDSIGNAILQLQSYVATSKRNKYTKAFYIKEILFVKHQDEPKESAFGYTLENGASRYFATEQVKNVLFTDRFAFANEVVSNGFANTTLQSKINLSPDWCNEITSKGFRFFFQNDGRVVQVKDTLDNPNIISVSTAWMYGTPDNPYYCYPFITFGNHTIYGDMIKVANTENDLVESQSLTYTNKDISINCKLKQIVCSDPFKKNSSLDVQLFIKDTNGDTVYVDPKTLDGLNENDLSFTVPFTYLQPDKKYVYQFGFKTNQYHFNSDEYPFTAPSSDYIHERLLPVIMAKDQNISIFWSALQATGLADSLQTYCDPSYTVGIDSTTWTNNALVISTASGYDNVAYMPQRLVKYTAFVEPDYVYNQYGIHSLEDLKRKAAELYDPVYPEDKDVTDPTDRRNSLNRFVAYHLLDRMGYYYSLTAVDGPSSTLATNNFNRQVLDIADWYETLMPHASLKCSFPSGTETGLYINRRGIEDHADNYGIQVRGAKLTPPTDMPDNEAYNGIYHYIDDIIAYDQKTQSTVMNERMRIDCTTLSPDFMTSGARGHHTKFSAENGKYGGWDNTHNYNNKQTCLGFKAGSAKNISFKDNETHLHVRPRTLSFWSYQGDEVTIKGSYDVTVKLPPLPEGDYELRLFTCVGWNSRGIIQFYINGTECSDPVDMRPNGNNPAIGWKSDYDIIGQAQKEAEAAGKEFTSEDKEKALEQFDREFREKGWMKGMDSYGSSSGSPFGASFRTQSNTLRRIIGHFHADGKTDNYLRMQQHMDSEYNEINFDMIEICPKSIYDNSTVPEDRN